MPLEHTKDLMDASWRETSHRSARLRRLRRDDKCLDLDHEWASSLESGKEHSARRRLVPVRHHESTWIGHFPEAGLGHVEHAYLVH
jgi:hypothetical protein